MNITNNIKRAIGSLYFRIAITQLRDSQDDFDSQVFGFDKITNALKPLEVSATNLDTQYWFASWDTWQSIISVLNPIVQNFNWVSERFDCDNRANLMSSLVSLMFELNTCSTLYCDVYDATTGAFKYAHTCNLIVDINDNVWLWDVDNGGQFTKITSNSPVMGVNRYQLYSIRAY